MAKASPFKLQLQQAQKPRTLVRQTFGDGLTPLTWFEWIADNAPAKRFAGAFEPRLRLAEPDVSDADGAKYIVVGSDYRSNKFRIVDAVEHMLDREQTDDRVVVLGSLRPVAEWRIPEGMRTHVVCVVWGGVTLREAKLIESAVGDVRSSAAMVTLRVRMRKGTLSRIKKAAEYERLVYNDGGKRGQYVSEFCEGPIIQHLEAVEAAQRAAAEADFGGRPRTSAS
jgi:hypothetical protein